MVSARAEESSVLRSEPWAVHVSGEATTIEDHIRLTQATMPLEARQQAVIQVIQGHLDEVRHATTRRGRLGLQGLFDRWWGTSIMRAYQHLHAAKVYLVDLLPSEEINALAPYVVARATAVLNPDDPRRVAAGNIVQLPAGRAKRAGLSRAMRFAYQVSDQHYVQLRSFRNVVFASAMLMVVLMAALVLVVAFHPTMMPLCFTPITPLGTESIPPDGYLQVTVLSICPSGRNQDPTSGDVIVIAGLGLLGGALAAAVALRRVRGTSTPYNVPLALALLKVPTGSFTAVAGIVLLTGGVVPGLTALDSQSQILAYALVLGYAQQIATRFLDDRAQTILSAVPSKDPDAGQPAPAPAAPPPRQRQEPDTTTDEQAPPRSSE
ncbi:MAG: hypothetical protein ACRDSR_24090 [Pseudonocardiaceae bacterium]